MSDWARAGITYRATRSDDRNGEFNDIAGRFLELKLLSHGLREECSIVAFSNTGNELAFKLCTLRSRGRWCLVAGPASSDISREQQYTTLLSKAGIFATGSSQRMRLCPERSSSGAIKTYIQGETLEAEPLGTETLDLMFVTTLPLTEDEILLREPQRKSVPAESLGRQELK